MIAMHLSNCEHPVRVYNQYTKEFMYVPCGKCDSCRNARANDWVNRLKVESKCWKYVYFFTLTYAMDKRPFFSVFHNRLFIPDLKSLNPDLEPCCIDILQEYEDNHCSDEWISRNNTWIQSVVSNGKLPHLSKYHCQLFVKRLRKNLKNLVVSKYGKENVTLSDYLVRYYLIGEYGSTAFAPHYHGLLFFNSEKEFSCIKEAIFKSWTLGIVDSSLVRSDASQYVASYLNSTYNLPQVLQHRSVCPFQLCSKATPIGTLSYQNEDFEELFNNASYKFVQQNAKGDAFVDVPLWRCIKDRIFPRLPFFNEISHNDRISLYSSVPRFEKFSGKEACLTSFLRYIDYCYYNGIFNSFFTLRFRLYLDKLVYKYKYGSKEFENNLIHLYYISNRVYYQSIIWNKTLENYVSQIELFYENVKKEKLKDYFIFQQEYSEEYGCQSLVGLDLTFLKNMIDSRLEDVSHEELLILGSYGIDTEKFFSDDLSIRYGYIKCLLPNFQKDFTEFQNNQHILAEKRVKKKVKNEYLDNLHSPYAGLIKLLSSF